MLKRLLLFVVCFSLSLISSPSNIPAQVAVEYGNIAGKTVVNAPDLSRSPEKAIQREPSKKRERRKEKISKRNKNTKSKNSGPLVIEKRGKKYERVN